MGQQERPSSLPFYAVLLFLILTLFYREGCGGGVGDYHGAQHARNASYPLKGPVQTVLRAELRGLLHVADAETEPCLVLIDNQAEVVVDALESLDPQHHLLLLF